MIRPLLALAVLLALGTGAYAGEASRSYGLTNGCQDWKIVHDIVSRFGWAEGMTFGEPNRIERLGDFRQVGFAPVGESKIERRYCQASATINTQARPATVYYLIESSQGLFGIGARVEFCVAGFDRWHVHDGDCNTVRPLYYRRG